MACLGQSVTKWQSQDLNTGNLDPVYAFYNAVLFGKPLDMWNFIDTIKYSAKDTQKYIKVE